MRHLRRYRTATNQATGRPRDAQRQKLYDWEEATIGVKAGHQMPDLEVCRQYVKIVCDRIGRRSPEVRDGRGSRRPMAYFEGWGDDWINLPRHARTDWVILHELAHVFTPDNRRVAGHGPEFVRVYIELVAQILKLPKGELIKSAQAAGLKIAPAPLWGQVIRRKLTVRRLKQIIGRDDGDAVHLHDVHCLSRHTPRLTRPTLDILAQAGAITCVRREYRDVYMITDLSREAIRK